MNFLINVISVTATSPDLELFIDMIANPQDYKGRAIYVKKLDPIAGQDSWPDPFLFEEKFYFNESGEWFESPFVKSGLLEWVR